MSGSLEPLVFTHERLMSLSLDHESVIRRKPYQTTSVNLVSVSGGLRQLTLDV
jgi:hypothetical protein